MTLETTRTLRFATIALGLGLTALTAQSAQAADKCFKITGWSTNAYGSDQAELELAPCTQTPSGWGWVPVFGEPGSKEFWVLVSISDPFVSSGNWFDGLPYLTDGADECIPEIIFAPDDRDPHSDGGESLRWWSPSTPSQIHDGDVVRLRHVNQMTCVAVTGGDGARARAQTCSTTAAQQLFVVEEDGNTGRYWLRNTEPEPDQCLYNHGSDGAHAHNWTCWGDPNMLYSLTKGNVGYQLENKGQCMYNYTDGFVHHWGCYPDDDFEYHLDVVDLANPPFLMCEVDPYPTPVE